MKVDKKVKELPWPEAYHGGKQTFRVTLNWPVVDGEKLLVVTFTMNVDREKNPWERKRTNRDFRLICSKKQSRAAILMKGDRSGKRWTLGRAMSETAGSSPTYCYPEISEKDEIALAKWLWRRGTNNHLMPELSEWVDEAIEAETQAERDTRGELRDEDVNLCPEELPQGLVEYIRREVLPTDEVLIYKKGNVRGTCFCCGQKVRAVHPQRFRQHSFTNCPNCGAKVLSLLETSDSFRVDYVEDIVTLQKGTDGATVFLRQWHLCRDMTAEWENISAQLEEIARYAIRGNRVAKWQKEGKESYYMKSYRYALDDWTRVKSVTAVYDGRYFFYQPEGWRDVLEGTSLKYCDLASYAAETKKNGRDRNTIRFLMDWARYPAVEKLWKAGYTDVVHEKIRGLMKRNQHTIRWTKNSIQEAIKFPFRLLKAAPPGKWTMDRMRKTAEAWELVKAGTIRERELAELVDMPCPIEYIKTAMGHASIHKIVDYVRKQTDRENEHRRREKEQAEREGKCYYGGMPPIAPQTYRDYLRDCVKLGLDLDDPAVLFPKNLDQAHQRTIAQVKHKASEEQRRAFQARIETLGALEWEKDGLLIRLPTSADELTAEGAALHHCVGGYIDQMVRGVTTILFVRDGAKPDEPFYTLEWKEGRVVQCRTSNNKSYEHDERVHSFVDAWVARVTKKTKRKTKKAAAAA